MLQDLEGKLISYEELLYHTMAKVNQFWAFPLPQIKVNQRSSHSLKMELELPQQELMSTM